MKAYASGLVAITTRYLGPTDHRGSRIIATAPDVRVTVDYAHELDGPQNHARAALALAHRAGWDAVHDGSYLVGGAVRGGMAWVFTTADTPTRDRADAEAPMGT